MNTGVIVKASRQFGRSINKNSPTILTALGVGGLVSTVILAVKATPKAMEILEREKQFRLEEYNDDRDLEILDTISLTWETYLPTTIMGLATIACMIGSNSIHLRRNAALASLFSITETALKEYQAKVVEKIGDSKEEKIRGEIAQDHLDAKPLDSKNVLVASTGDMLCFDSLSGRYFISDVETIRRIQNDFNKRLMTEMDITLNELYDEMNLDPIEMGNLMGWTIDKGMVDIFFAAKLSKDGKPCIVIEHKNPPTSFF